MLDENKGEVILYSLPPSWSFLPTAGLSCISNYLKQNNIITCIKYLNVLFERKLNIFKIGQSEQEVLSFFVLILETLEGESSKKLDRIIKFVESSFPELLLVENECSLSILEDLIEESISIIDNSLNCNVSTKLHGFTSKFNQWIPACVIAKRIKQLQPDAKTLIGGWTNKKAAIDFLNTNNYFDYAIWGEGEVATLKLVQTLIENNQNRLLKSIPGLVYKENGSIHVNDGATEYVSEECLKGYDYSDYFKCLKLTNYEPPGIYIPIERNRGCHWNKCEFCYLNQGYLFRTKQRIQIITELEDIYTEPWSKTYNISIAFMDNDIVGNDILKFEEFLNDLIQFKKKFTCFEIGSAEVVTKNFNSSIISKMRDAGFKNVQIGLEAISSPLLKKMNKKQTFSDNLFFMVEALYNDIKVTGANIIYNTPDETEDHIIQSLNNLHFFRFLIGKVDFNLIPLGVANHSRYLGRIKSLNQGYKWTYNPLASISNIRFTETVDRFSLFDFTSDSKRSPLWDVFEKNLNFYIKSKFRYKIISKDLGFIYKEFCGRKKVKEIEFEEGAYKRLFKVLSSRTYDIQDLRSRLGMNEIGIKQMLSDLKKEGLIFYDEEFKGITSIIRL